jgi:hypothetical protein
MARLKAKRRKSLPASAFAYPAQRRYPIHDKAHARNALARAAQAKTYGTYAHVAAAVRRRYPSIAVGGAKKKTRKKSRRR